MKRAFLSLLAIVAISFTSCSDDNDEPTTSNLTLNINGLENLGANEQYEGWIIVNGSPVSTGTFSVNDAGALSKTSFTVDASNLAAAEKFVLSIEPIPDTDAAPSAIKILAGDFSGNSAAVNTGIIADFSAITGKYILTTPSTAITTDNNKGVWFLDPTSGTPSLTLPTLPTGWRYEGWAIIDGKPVSSGRFSSATGADEDNNPYSGPDKDKLPGFPGEDFIMGTANGVDLAAATHIAKVVVSIEPEPDNSPNPFLLKPLVGADLDESSATAPTLHDLSGTLPTGTVTR